MINLMKHIISALVVLSLISPAVTFAENSYKYNYSMVNDECADLDDPMEKLNRKIFIFNSVLDYFILRPIAKGYTKLLNDYTRDKVSNFVDNVNVPLTFVNNVLQADSNNSLISFWQFTINSTLGVGGFFDIAGDFGIKTSPQTFGSTLAHYGAGPGPYVVLPFFGSSNMRDIFDPLIFNSKFNPLKHKLHRDFSLAVTGVTLVQKRSEALPFTDYVTKNSSDPYVTIRSTAHQYREKNLRYPASYRCTRVYKK
jgi:phospholipid-binding lipoprotein MlaA